jgi:hypothetical protein
VSDRSYTDTREAIEEIRRGETGFLDETQAGMSVEEYRQQLREALENPQGALRRPGRRAQPAGPPQAGPEALGGRPGVGIPLGAVPAPANQRDDGLLAATLDTIAVLARCPPSRWCTWTPATTTSRVGRS